MQNNTLTIVNAVEKQVTLPTDLKAAGIKNGYIDVSDFWASPLVKSKKELNNKSQSTAFFIPEKKCIKNQPTRKLFNELEHSKVNANQMRAALAYGINNKEPVNKIVEAVKVGNNKPI